MAQRARWCAGRCRASSSRSKSRVHSACRPGHCAQRSVSRVSSSLKSAIGTTSVEEEASDCLRFLPALEAARSMLLGERLLQVTARSCAAESMAAQKVGGVIEMNELLFERKERDRPSGSAGATLHTCNSWCAL